jgi:predicted esterase
VIGGFSQGVGMAIYLANHLKKYDVGGVIACSGYYLSITELKKDSQIKYFLAHGGKD